MGVIRDSQKFSGHQYIGRIARSSLRSLSFLVTNRLLRFAFFLQLSLVTYFSLASWARLSWQFSVSSQSQPHVKSSSTYHFVSWAYRVVNTVYLRELLTGDLAVRGRHRWQGRGSRVSIWKTRTIASKARQKTHVRTAPRQYWWKWLRSVAGPVWSRYETPRTRSLQQQVSLANAKVSARRPSTSKTDFDMK